MVSLLHSRSRRSSYYFQLTPFLDWIYPRLSSLQETAVCVTVGSGANSTPYSLNPLTAQKISTTTTPTASV
jgi:hypothetical protein